jgi:hypothetical protein
VPAGSRLTVRCATKKKSQRNRCPEAYRKRNAAGTVNLATFTRRALPAGTTLSIEVTKPNAVGAAKVVRIVKSKEPKVASFCMPPNRAELRRSCG